MADTALYDILPKPAEGSGPTTTGTEALRRHLKSRLGRPGVVLSNIARDINDDLATKSNRAIAREIAERMAGSAGADVAAGIARSLIGSLPSSTTSGTTESALAAFIEGGDLKVEIKQALAAYLNGGSAAFDPERDLLTTVGPGEPVRSYVAPAPFEFDPKVHFDAKVAAKASRIGPQPVKPVPARPKGPRPGWADGWT